MGCHTASHLHCQEQWQFIFKKETNRTESLYTDHYTNLNKAINTKQRKMKHCSYIDHTLKISSKDMNSNVQELCGRKS